MWNLFFSKYLIVYIYYGNKCIYKSNIWKLGVIWISRIDLEDASTHWRKKKCNNWDLKRVFIMISTLLETVKVDLIL